MRLIQTLLIVATIWMVWVNAAWAADNGNQLEQVDQGAAFPMAKLQPGKDAAPLHHQVRFRSIDAEKGQELAPLMEQPKSFKGLQGNAFNLGPALGRFLVVVSVVNDSDQKGEWLLTTNRGALRDFALDEWQKGKIVSRIDGSDMEQVRENLQAYHAFTHPFTLAPGQSRTFLVSFEAVHSSLIPLQVKTTQSIIAARYGKLTVYIGSSVGMLTIILISMAIYSRTGRTQFFWMGIAELAHVLYVIHVGGYTTFYYLYDKGPWVHIVGNILPTLFAIAMAQFARSFINTKQEFHKLDRILSGMIIFGAIIIVIQIAKNLYGDPIDLKIFDILSGLVTTVIVLLLPYVAIIATRQLGSYHWPLIFAWGSLCLFVIYGTIMAFGLFPGLPYNWHITGPVGLFEAIFAFWALILYLDKLNQERLNNAVQLVESRVAQQEIKQKANDLTMQKEDALSTIRDQENLIHASGHDSQHVLMALKTIIKFSDELGSDKLSDNLPEMLRSSAGHLEDIIRTTMANPVAGFQSADFVVLSMFKASDLLRNMENIYGPMMRKEQMRLSLESDEDLMLVSDRALLARILSNLLSNCLKFAKGSDVTIALRLKNEQVCITVTDGGPGIAEPIVEKIRHATVTRVMPQDTDTSTGFGLLSSQRIAATLCGTMELTNTTAGSAEITVALPHLTQENDLNPLSVEEVRGLLEDYQPIDIDDLDDVWTEPDSILQDKMEVGPPILPISYDNSSQMRTRIMQVATLMLLKPVNMAMMDHPILSATTQRHEPGKATSQSTQTGSEDAS